MKKIEPSAFVKAVSAYKSPLSPTPVDLYLNGNEGEPPGPQLLEAVGNVGVERIRRYPDDFALKQRIASLLDVETDRVLVTAGSDDALARICRAVLEPGREIILPSPTFEMLDRYAKLCGATIKQVFWPFGAFPMEAVIAKSTDQTALLSLVTPNSPMGQVLREDELRALSDALPGVLLLLDLAYTEFADVDLTAVGLSLPNVVVTRSLSKAWGLAGLRVGYAAGPPEIIAWLTAAGNPYCVSALSLAAAEERLRTGESAVRQMVAKVVAGRKVLTERLASLGAETAPSQGNFVFARFKDALWVRDALAGLGIAIRAFPGMPYLEGACRMTVPGNDRDFDRLAAGLETVLDPEALLFDIDDTLADVTESYRQATVATAAAFGVTINFDDITAAKAAGDANNDWELTCRLVNDAGVSAGLADVTEKFEFFYQGTAETPGFKAKETLLCEVDLLERLAARIPLGIVTGRPKRDADEFLEKMGIRHLFGAVVTMDDAPPKPSPEPVRLALKMLDVKRAWMVGDTPDDIRAARGAGVLPLGVLAPADDPDVARAALLSAGAGRVLSDLYDLEKRLP